MSSSRTTTEEQVNFKSGPPDPTLLWIRDLIYRVCGIYMPDNKLYFLQERCTRRTETLKAGTLRNYLDLLTTGPDHDGEIRNLLNEVTIGDTCFFRNKAQLEALSKVVLPKVMETRAKLSSRRVKLWSCGCSTGEEPYTLAMLLEESAARVKGWAWEINATDLNDQSLAKANEGLYDEYALRNTPAFFRQKYFAARGHRFAISEAVKERVNFSRLNLRDDSKVLFMKGNDVIFCSNVLIYFDADSKRRVVQHLYNNLTPGGYLFLGNAESLYGVSEEFHLVHFPGATAYLRPTERLAEGVRNEHNRE
jgi:chemotaxis protein methyltransferase CheR